MITKCICTNCAGHLEFEEENAGERIPCPHCGFETTLFLPGTQPENEQTESALWVRLWRNSKARVGTAVLLLAGLVFCLYHWGVPWVWDLFPWLESKTGAVIVLALSCLIIPFLIVWLVFPVILLLQLRKLTRVLEVSSTAQLFSYEQSAPTEPQPEPEPEGQPETVKTVETEGNDPAGSKLI